MQSKSKYSKSKVIVTDFRSCQVPKRQQSVAVLVNRLYITSLAAKSLCSHLAIHTSEYNVSDSDPNLIRKFIDKNIIDSFTRFVSFFCHLLLLLLLSSRLLHCSCIYFMCIRAYSYGHSID